MADNFQTPYGQFGAKDVGAALLHQFIKLSFGTGVVPADGDAANGLDVDVTRVGGAGGTQFRDLDAKATTGINVKNTAGKLLTLVASNQHATLKRYLKLYDKATAPVAGDTPKATIVLMPATTILVLGDSIGASFPTGIGYRASTAVADADNTDPTANDVVISGTYA
jgi:hypothetical protein